MTQCSSVLLLPQPRAHRNKNRHLSSREDFLQSFTLPEANGMHPASPLPKWNTKTILSSQLHGWWTAGSGGEGRGGEKGEGGEGRGGSKAQNKIQVLDSVKLKQRPAHS